MADFVRGDRRQLKTAAPWGAPWNHIVVGGLPSSSAKKYHPPLVNPGAAAGPVLLRAHRGRWAAILPFLCGFLVAASAAAPTLSPGDAAFLDRLERATFDFFWHEANPKNGLIKDRSTPNSPCSIAAVGFGLSAIHIAIERGWISREAGRERVRLTLRTFAQG